MTVTLGLLKGSCLSWLPPDPSTHRGAALQQTPFLFVSMICDVVSSL